MTTLKTKKIPQLNLAGAVYGTDQVVINQRGATKRATIDLLREAITSDFAHARDIEIRKSDGYIQWKYVDSTSWTNLVPLLELQGPPGSGSLSQTVFTADGVKKIFNGISGIISSDALKCNVTVGGLTQTPNVSFTVSTENGGSVIFDEAPPASLKISVCVFQ